MNIKFWISNPTKVISRIKYFSWELMNPDKPWWCPGTVDFCVKFLKPNMEGLEFGSGRSTVWLAGKVAKLVSVEHHPMWYEKVKNDLSEMKRKNVDYRLVEVALPYTTTEILAEGEAPEYVTITDDIKEGTLDFVSVDGRFRSHCIIHSIPKLKSGGIIIVDDIDYWGKVENIPVPKNWKVIDDSTNGLKRCIIWQSP